MFARGLMPILPLRRIMSCGCLIELLRLKETADFSPAVVGFEEETF